MALSDSRLYDPFAEMVVVACAVSGRRGAQLAHERLDRSDFHDPVLADLFDAAPGLPTTPADYDADPWAPTLDRLRMAAAAEATNVRLGNIEEICAVAPVMDDGCGVYARRVRSASMRRSIAMRVEEMRTAMETAELDEALDSLRHVLFDLEAMA